MKINERFVYECFWIAYGDDYRYFFLGARLEHHETEMVAMKILQIFHVMGR